MTFEPSERELATTAEQLAACSSVGLIFDNSVSELARRRVRLQCDSTGIMYLSDDENVGTAVALNRVVQYGLSRGADWTLYLDQDSVIAPNFAESIDGSLRFAEASPAVAIIGSQIVPIGARSVPSEELSERFQRRRFVIASGTLFRNSAVAELGGFDSEMFLDVVDHEFCMRVRRMEKAIYCDNARVLYHGVGLESRSMVPRLGFSISLHPGWRRELMWRNSTLLVRRYALRFPAECLRHILIRCIETVLGTVVYRRANYIGAALRGVCAGVSGRPVEDILAKRPKVSG